MDFIKVTPSVYGEPNLYNSDGEYKGTVTGRTRDGTMSLEFYKDDHNSTNVKVPNYREYAKALLQDRKFTGNTTTEDETPPNNTKMIEQKLTFHMYGALNPTDPYTEEGVDSQFREKDPRGFSPSNYQWQNALAISKKIAENYDFAPTGDVNYDSGTNPPDKFQEKISNAFYILKSLLKNFASPLDNPRPYGLYKRDVTKVPEIRYSGEFESLQFPLPRDDVNRKVIPQTDVKLRSLTKPDHVPGVSAYGLGIKASGLTTLKSQIDEIIFRSNAPQMENSIVIAPSQPPVVESVLKNALIIDRILDEQMIQDSKSNSWIQTKQFPPMQTLTTRDDDIKYVETTLLPGVYATMPPKTVNFGNKANFDEFYDDEKLSLPMYAKQVNNINRYYSVHDLFHDDNTFSNTPQRQSAITTDANPMLQSNFTSEFSDGDFNTGGGRMQKKPTPVNAFLSLYNGEEFYDSNIANNMKRINQIHKNKFGVKSNIANTTETMLNPRTTKKPPIINMHNKYEFGMEQEQSKYFK